MGQISLARVHGGIGTTGVSVISSITIDQFGRVYSLSAAAPLNDLQRTNISVLCSIDVDVLGRVRDCHQADAVNSIDTTTQFAVVTSIKTDALGRVTYVGKNDQLGYLALSSQGIQLPFNFNTIGRVITSLKTDFLGRVLSAGAANANVSATTLNNIAPISSIEIDDIGRVANVAQANTVNALNVSTNGAVITGVNTDALGRVTEVNKSNAATAYNVGTFRYSVTGIKTDTLGRVTDIDLGAPVNLTVSNGLSVYNPNGTAGNPFIRLVPTIKQENADFIISSSNQDQYDNATILATSPLTANFDSSIVDGFRCTLVNVGTGELALSSDSISVGCYNNPLTVQYQYANVIKVNGGFIAYGS